MLYNLVMIIDPNLVAGINLVVCVGIMWSCVCRLNTDICRIHLTARLRYMLLMVGALACGLQPVLFKEWPTVGTMILTLSILVGLLLGALHWEGYAGAGKCKGSQ